MADLDQISMILGEIRAGQQALSKMFDEEKDAARDSRATIHRRLDEQVENMHKLDTSVQQSSQSVTQIGNEVATLKTRVDTYIEPAIDDWKKIKNMGIGMVTLVGLGGATVATILISMFTNFGSVVSSIAKSIKIP